jgi:hypothetical protein
VDPRGTTREGQTAWMSKGEVALLGRAVIRLTIG